MRTTDSSHEYPLYPELSKDFKSRYYKKQKGPPRRQKHLEAVPFLNPNNLLSNRAIDYLYSFLKTLL